MLNADAVRNALDVDPWTIYEPSRFINAGLPESFVNKFVRVFKSDTRDPKSTIFNDDGEVIKQLKGVYALDILWGIAREMGADTSEAETKSGRGFIARCLKDAIKEKL